MSNKLLSEQELKAELMNISGGMYTEEQENKMIALIQSQKLAWADYIIGEDADADGAKTDRLFYSIEGGNIVRKFQRQRNNLNATSGEEK